LLVDDVSKANRDEDAYKTHVKRKGVGGVLAPPMVLCSRCVLVNMVLTEDSRGQDHASDTEEERYKIKDGTRCATDIR